MSDAIVLRIESCRDCPRLKITEVRDWKLGNRPGYRYDCTQAHRQIAPSDGVEPPPDWCPKREELQDAD